MHLEAPGIVGVLVSVLPLSSSRPLSTRWEESADEPSSGRERRKIRV